MGGPSIVRAGTDSSESGRAYSGNSDEFPAVVYRSSLFGSVAFTTNCFEASSP
jgi:hypothetical protein